MSTGTLIDGKCLMILDHAFDDEFYDSRDSILAPARNAVCQKKDLFRAAGKKLDEDYGPDTIRVRREKELLQHRVASLGQPTMSDPQRRSKGPPESRVQLQHWQLGKLRYAVIDFLGRNQDGDPLRALGRGVAEAERRESAYRGVLLGILVLDPSAGEALKDITSFAQLPWATRGEDSREDDRVEVCRYWRLPIMRLLQESCSILGIVPNRNTAATPTVSSRPDGADVENQSRQSVVDHERMRVQASSFRAGGEAVYPGAILVLSDEYHARPVTDDAFDPTKEWIVGIALWGTRTDFAAGCTRVDTAGGHLADNSTPSFVPLVTGEMHRPRSGVGRLDAWIARADALRRLLAGTPTVFGGIPLTPEELMAAIHEIAKVVREQALRLLQYVPSNHRDARRTLAVVADAPSVNPDQLSAAIVELLATASEWTASPSDGDALKDAREKVLSAPPSETARERGPAESSDELVTRESADKPEATPHGKAGLSRDPKSLPDGAFISETELAEIFQVSPNSLRKRLREWRPQHLNNDWMPTEHPRSRDPRFLYRVGSVRPLLESMKKDRRRTGD